MHDLKKIYLCLHCGEVDGVLSEFIDCDRDRVETFMMCDKCHHREVKPKIQNGLECYRQMSEGEILAEQGFYDPPEDFDYGDDGEYE